MIGRVVRTLLFAAKSFVLFFVMAAGVVALSCYRHGDRGPWPEADYIAWLPIVAMLIAYATEEP